MTRGSAEVPPAAVLCCGEEGRVCKPRSEVLPTRGRCGAETPGEAPSPCLTRYRAGSRLMAAAGASLGRSARRRAWGWGMAARGRGSADGGEAAAGGDSAGWGGECTGARGGGASRGLGEPAAPLRARSSPCVPAPVVAASSTESSPLQSPEPSSHLPGRGSPWGTRLPPS